MHISKTASFLILMGLVGGKEVQANGSGCENYSCTDYASYEECCCENYFYVGADYLYWRVWQEGLDRAGTGPQFTGPIVPVKFDWASGFRARLGAEFCCDWGVEGSYTYLRPDGKKTISGDRIFPTFLPSFVAGGTNFVVAGTVSFDSGETMFSSIDSKVEMNYNLIDVDFYKLMGCTPCFDFRLTTGVEVGLIDETTSDVHLGNLLIASDELGSDTETGLIPFQIDWKQSWDFCGAGLRLGFEGKYNICGGFFVESDLDFAFLFGRYKNKNHRTIPVFDESNLSGSLVGDAAFFREIFNDYYSLSMTENYNDFAGNAQLNLGGGWECRWSCFAFNATVAYDLTYWWDLAVFRHGMTGNAVTTSADQLEAQVLFAGTNSSMRFSRAVALHGLTVSLNLIF